jgi:hypothetical protein
MSDLSGDQIIDAIDDAFREIFTRSDIDPQDWGRAKYQYCRALVNDWHWRHDGPLIESIDD